MLVGSRLHWYDVARGILRRGEYWCYSEPYCLIFVFAADSQAAWKHRLLVA